MISFDKIKAEISTQQAAQLYGISVNHQGFACCPFHHEKTPSMKIDQRYHCFACQADGDVIDFTAKLFGLDMKSAAEKLAADFGIDISLEGSYKNSPSEIKTSKRILDERFDQYWTYYCKYLHLLKYWKEKYAPIKDKDTYDDRFVESLILIPEVEYYLDELWEADLSDQKKILDAFPRIVTKVETGISSKL